MKTLLTIAGFDPSSGAGGVGDLLVFFAHGGFGVSALTALTVQSTLGVEAVHPVEPEVLKATLECLARDVVPDGIKIGMLGTETNVVATARFIAELKSRKPGVPVVLDPVLVSSSGAVLLEEEGIQALREELIPLVDWVTPNLSELGLLVDSEVNSRRAMEVYGGLMADRYRTVGVVVTGGHLEPPDDLVVAPGGEKTWIPGTAIVSEATHGTGCAFASAMLCGLVDGMPAVDAARAAKRYVAEGIRRAPAVGQGKGPLDLLWPLRAKQPV